MPPKIEVSADPAGHDPRTRVKAQPRQAVEQSERRRADQARAMQSLRKAAGETKPKSLSTRAGAVGVAPQTLPLPSDPSGDAGAASAKPKRHTTEIDVLVKGVSEVAERKMKSGDAGVAATTSEAARPGAANATPAVNRTAKPTAGSKGAAFKTHEYIVYPAHGVGQIVAVEEQVVAGYKLELFVISFAKDKMILKVPLPKIASVGMRKLAEAPVVNRALETLTGRARVKRTMWSRRAQEYEAKINSGDLVAIAEVVRDLYRSDAQPEQSYSERQLYEAALDRVAREIAAVQKLTDSEALRLIEGQLQKGPRRGKAEDADAAADLDEADEGGIGEAA